MSVNEKIQGWLDSSIDRLVVEYDAQGRRASGNWEKDLEGEIEVKINGYKVRILGSKYTYWMENGRNAGKFPPISAIRKWIDDKGIVAEKISRNSLAFLIARKIAKEGYKGKPLVTNAITDEWVSELLEQVGMFCVEDLKSEVIKILKAA